MKQKNLGRYRKEAANALNSAPSHAWIDDAEGIAGGQSTTVVIRVPVHRVQLSLEHLRAH
jgi:hypothetical protein